MTESHDNAQLYAQIEETITKFADDVRTSIRRQNEELTAERAARTELERRVGELAAAIDRAPSASSSTAFDDRQTLADHTRRIERTDERVESLDQVLRRFDEQAALMVSHFSQVAEDLTTRFAGLEERQHDDMDERMVAVGHRIDEVSASLTRQTDEFGSMIGRSIEPLEDRVNERLMATEVRLRDDLGVRAAELEAHVGQIGAGFDGVVATLSERVGAVDQRFAEFDEALVSIREAMNGFDEEALDEMKEQISSALGQAELVRIEMDRFQEKVGESLEKSTARLTAIETTVQDQAMDVSTAVQLERLEEVERAVLMLDPDVFALQINPDDPDTAATDDADATVDADDSGAHAASPMAPPPVDGVADSAGIAPELVDWDQPEPAAGSLTPTLAET